MIISEYLLRLALKVHTVCDINSLKRILSDIRSTCRSKNLSNLWKDCEMKAVYIKMMYIYAERG